MIGNWLTERGFDLYIAGTILASLAVRCEEHESSPAS